MSNSKINKHVVVVGGGIIGLCAALSLQREGYLVTIIDASELGGSTVKWSCGQLSVGEIIPLSKPGILTKIPGWMLDQKGPLALRPTALPALIPWFARFLSNGRHSRIKTIAEAMSSLTRHVFDDYERLLDNDTLRKKIVNKPIIQVFDSVAGVDSESSHNLLRSQLGFDSRVLKAGEINELEPSFAGKFMHGILLPQWRFVTDTESFLTELTNDFISKGGKRINNYVRKFIENGSKITEAVIDGGEKINADYFVISSGVGSSDFFSQLELSIPLQAVAGYQALVRNPGVKLNHSVIYSDGGFCFTPMERGLQIGGTIEFTGKSRVPNFKRAQLILSKAKRFLPDMNVTDVEYGMGYRPLLPDTKPVIDRSRRHKNVFLALGHGQLGLTLGAVTGRLITDLVENRKSAIDLSPFSAYRF